MKTFFILLLALLMFGIGVTGIVLYIEIKPITFDGLGVVIIMTWFVTIPAFVWWLNYFKKLFK